MVREINKQDFETLQHIAEFMKNMTQRKIAPEIGISYALLTKMIYGKMRITQKNKLKISVFLSKKAYELLVLSEKIKKGLKSLAIDV